MKRKNCIAKACFFILVFLVSIISCEVGLGSAVDTQPPSVTIDGPNVDAVIRDVFAITGRWSDDGSISEVKATLKRTNGNAKEVEIPGEWNVDPQLKETGTWKVLVDYEKENLVDGTYQATVSVKDNGKHITTQSTTFTIDNTAPVLVLSRPSIKEGQSGFDSYGRTFTLEGKAADDNEVSLIEVNVFENADSTEPLKTVELRNVPLTIEQDVAVYNSAEANDYAAIYGHTDENGIIQEIGDTELRYCTVKIYDAAERYPVDGSAQTDADKKGNSTDVYYMNSEITSLLQSGLKITDLYHIMNGNYEANPSRSVSSQDVVTQLNSLKVTKGKFSINPANNPKYIVTSINAKESNKDLDNVDYQFTSGNRYIEVEITPGLDGYPIDPNTVGLYLQECESDGTPKNDVEKVWLIKTGAEYHKTQEEIDAAEAAGQTLENEVGVYRVSGSTYKFKTSKIIHKNNYGVKIGNYYLIKVEGNDSQGVESGKIIQDGTYGFKLVSNEEKIELSVAGVPEYLPTDEEVWKDTNNPITFTATLSWEKGETPFDIYRANESKQYEKIKTITEAAVNNKWEYVDEFGYDALTELAATGETFPKQLNYILKNSSGDEISTTARINLKFDSEKPKISNVQITNSYEKKVTVNNEDKYVYYVRNVADNLCEISGTATDKNGIKRIILKIPGLADVEHEGGDGHFSFEDIDFHTLSGSVTATIIAYDNAGNSESYDIEFIFDTDGPVAQHEIDDKKKDLYFRIGSANNDDITKTTASKYGLTWNDGSQNNKIDEDVGSKYSNGAYGNDNTIQIRGNFTDAGSGVKRIYYQIRTDETEYTNEDGLKTLAKEIVEDTEKTKSFSLLETPETKRVFYNSTVTTSGNNTTYDGTVGGRIKGNITQLVQTDVTPNKPTKKFYKNVETNYKNSISGFGEGTNYLILVAEDNVGNLSVDVAKDVPYVDENGVSQNGNFVNYSLNVDTVVPDITTNSSDIIYTNQSGTIELSGTVNDTGAGIRSLKFYLNQDELEVYSGEDGDKPPLIGETQDIDYANITKCIVTQTTTAGKTKGENGEERYNDWSIIIPASKFSDAETTYTIYAVAKDNAGTGNEKKQSVGTIKVDVDGPTVTIASPTAGSSVNKEIVISGNVTDGNGAGVDTAKAPKLYWKTDEAAEWVELVKGTEQNPTAVKNTTWKTSSCEWSFTIDTTKLKMNETDVVSNGTTAYFTVSGTDKSGTGNVKFATTHNLVIDQNSDRPVIKFSNLDITKTDPVDGKIWITKEDLYASVSDDDGEVTSVKISFDGTTWKETDDQGNKYYTSENGLSYTIPSDKDGAQTIYFEVTDSKGTVFVSTLSTEEDDTVNAPKLAYKSSETGETVLNTKIDLKEPSIPCIYYSGEDFSTVTTEAALNELFNSSNTNIPADLTKWRDLTNIPEALGGSTKQIYILVKAKDENGIKSVDLFFGSGDAQTAIKRSENKTAALFKIDLSSIGTTIVEKKRIEVKTVDNANHNHTSTIDIEIDNVPPTVDIDSPSANAELYGTAGVAQTNVTVRGRTSDSSDVQDIYLAVTKGEDVEPATSGVSAYKSIKKRSALSWTSVFNGNSDISEDVYYTDLFNTYIDELYGEGTTTSATQKDICLWLYAVDKLGNSGKENPKKLPLTILTQGDKPIVSITYPSKESKVGGVITITGSTSIATNEVDKIFIQIDPAYNHENPAYNIAQNEFTSDWETSLQTLIDTATGAGKTIEYSIEDIENSEGTVVARGILAGGSKQSWNVILNAASEFNTEGNRDIAVRAYAISKSNKVSEPVITWFTLDPDSPTFGNNDPLTLVQYSTNKTGTGSITASMLYTPGMWIQGKWWLTGSVEDESGIDYVKLNGIDLESQYYEVTTTPYKGRKLNIPVGKAIDSETVYGPTITLVTKETGGEKTSTADIKLYYDNIPPEFESTTLKADQTNTLVQSDGVCEIKGTLTELGEQSGFKRIAFYVTRTLNSTNYVTDVMKAQGSGTDNCYTQNSLTSDGNLYWKTAANCTAKNGIEIEVPQDDVPAFARTGGLCRINDVIYTIKSITAGANGKKIVTIDSKIDNGTVNIDFALAQVIDNTVSELGITTYFGDSTHEITNDDGDEMVESYKESSGEWTVSINSKNIKDGTIQIHFVAYDQAGNKTYKTYNAIVANNAPRIAGVKFGTDTNGSGEVEESELRTGYSGIYAVEGLNKKPNITVNGQAANGVKISKLALPNDGTDITAIDDTKNSVMTVKGAIKIIPEVVGGNNGLSWTYSVNGTNKSTSANSLNNTHSGNDDIRSENSTTISIDTLTLLKDIPTDGNNVLGFTIWDKTEGTTPGTDSNKAELLLKVNVELRDETPPTAGIKPFYWDSIPIGDKNNSSIVYKDGIAFGHIELEKDLQETGFDYTGTEGEEFDLDPKVSGVIYLEGFAKDNVAVEKLYLNFPGLSGFGNFGLVAQRDRRDNSSTKGQMISVPNFADDGIELVSATEELKAEGNKEYNLVHWKIKIDTSRIATSAATNVLVQIKAEDRGKATLNGSSTSYDYQNPKKSSVPESFDLSKDQTGYKLSGESVEMSNGRPVYDSENQTPSYRIDVVPYIAKVYTSLASLKKNNWSVYNRTALGHYPVASDGTAYLYGFNLGNAGYVPMYGSVSLAEPADGATANNDYPSGPKSDTNPESEYAAYKVVTFPVSNVTTSGTICLKINGVETLNNKNNNEGRGSYTGSVNLEINPTGDETTYSTYYYNRQPNGDNNNLLTDDVEMDVWNISPKAVKPKNGTAVQPVMAIDPVNHSVGFAFVNGTLYFSMPYGTNPKGKAISSHYYWVSGIDFWTSIGLAYDKYGHSFATVAGGDINASKADQFRLFTSRWGTGTYDKYEGYNNGTNQFRLEMIGQIEFDTNKAPYNNYNKERVQSPSLATTAVNTNTTTLYLAYYDDINDEIRFKWGNFTDTSKGDSGSTLFGDYYGLGSEAGDKWLVNFSNQTPSDYGIYRLNHNSLIAGQTKNKVVKSDGTTESAAVMTNEQNPQPVYAGKYVSIAAIQGAGNSDDAVVAVWWDAHNSQLLYSYNMTPKSVVEKTYLQADTGWTKPVPIFENGIGEYCKVCVDANEGVHITAYDGLNGDVWYAYIPDFENTSNIKKCLVDSYGIIGTELNIDVALVNNNPVPYISYYAGSSARPKMAYWADSGSVLNASEGAIQDSYTGNWEITIIPTSSRVPEDHINIGVWKTSAGELTYSTKDGGIPTESNIGVNTENILPGVKQDSYGLIYGNGSKNPVLGYAITDGSNGYIETAQMK